MRELITFNFEAAEVRTVVGEDGEPWFVGKDVCDVLGYADSTNAMKQHCKGVVKRHPLQTPGGMQEARVLSEGDVLRLIVRSRLPAAEQFERWVFDEVLPAIRKTGSYSAAPAADPMQVLNDPAAMRGLLLGYTERVITLEAAIAAQAPKVEAFDRFATVSDGSFCIREAAKLLQMQERKLYQLLTEEGWIYRHPNGRSWLGYDVVRKKLWVEHKTTTGTKDDGSEWQSVQARITARGLARLSEIITKRGAPPVAETSGRQPLMH